MQPPTKAENIYPRTKENLEAIFLYYFPRVKHSEIDKHVEHVYDIRGLELNQIEFVARQASENYEKIKEILAPTGIGLAKAYLLTSSAIYGFPIMSNNSQPVIRQIREMLSLNESLQY